MSFYQPPSGNGMGGPPRYNPAMTTGPQRAGRSMQIFVNLAANQSVEIRLNANSPWIVGLVLAVLTVAERNLAVEYEIRYSTGNGVTTKVFPATSPNIRAV